MKQKGGKKRPGGPQNDKGGSKKAKRLNYQKLKKKNDVPTGKPEASFRYLSPADREEKFPGVEVPSCFHGPYLPFLATNKTKPGAEPELIFGCSYNRSVKHPNCPEKKPARVPKCKHKGVTEEDTDKYTFCHQCNKLYKTQHGKFTIEQTTQPMKNSLLYAKVSEKTEAQYLLSDRSTEFIQSQIVSKFDTILCVGMPRLHEAIKIGKVKKTSYLLDMDARFLEFFPDSYFKYNMFNCTFFGEEDAVIDCPFKLTGKVLVAVDPPYGGLASSFIDAYSKLQSLHPEATFQIAWIFPMFHLKEIKSKLPNVNMLHYCVDYNNHERFQATLTGRNASVSRIYTDIDRKSIEITDKLNRFCKKCSFYVLKNMTHCAKCDDCVGPKFQHCVKCDTCVKTTWEHCQKCERCRPPYHSFHYKAD